MGISNRFCAAAAGLALSLAGAPAFAACSMGKFAELPVTMAGLRPMVPAKINGAEVMFIADSGAFYSSINPATAARLKLSLQITAEGFALSGLGGEARASFTVVKSFGLAAASFPNVPFLVTGGGGEVDGLLGQNVLGLADVEYDLSHGAIRLVKATGCGQSPLAYWAPDKASVINIRAPEEHNPHTIGDIYVNGVKMRAVFDTGASVSMLTLSAAARIGLKPGSPEMTEAGLSFGIGRRPLKAWVAPVTSFKIGDEEIRNTRLRVVETDFDYADMLIGADFFLSHRVYVANSQRKLYFTYIGGPVFNLTSRTRTQEGANGEVKESTRDQTRADPTDADGFARRAAAFAARRDFEAAIGDFTRAIELKPTEPKYFYQRAQTRAANRQPFLAMADLDQTLKLSPEDVQALMMRAGLRIGGNDVPAAVSDIDAAARILPNDSDLRLGLASLYQGADRIDSSLAQLDRWITSHSDDGRLAQALNSRCWIRALSGKDLDKALADCNRAIRAAPKMAALLDSRGLVQLRMGQYDKAIADYDAALALDPKLAWSLYGRGLAKQSKGMKAEGQADVAAAIAISARLPDQAKKYGIAASGS